jgi:hypothetical protein
MPVDPVVIDFAIRGLADVTRAFESVTERAARFEKAMNAQSVSGGRARVRSAQDESKAKERVAIAATKAAERQERQKTRDADAEARRRQQIVRKSSEMSGRYASDLAKQEQRAAQDATRAIQREEDRKLQIRIRSSEMAGREAARAAAQEIAASERTSSRWAARGKRVGGIMTNSVGGLLSGAGQLVGATMGIGGGMLLADAARREVSAEKQAGLLINTVTTGSKPPPEATLGNILGKAGALSKELGVDKADIVGGALEYSRKAKGGDITGAMGNMGFFAEMSKVTGADINDIAGAAGTLQSQNPKLDKGGMQQMLLDVYAQGKAGSMSMVDVAKQMGTLASTRSSFQGDTATNQRKLLALGQLAAPEGTVEEAGTYIKDLSMALSKPKDLGKLKAWGVKTDKFGAVESPENLIESVFRGSKGDMSQIAGVFGARGVPLFRALEGSYKGAGGGEAGIQAVRAQMASVTGATMTIDQLHSQNAQIDSAPGEKFHNAMNKVTEELEEKLAPAMASFADSTLPKLVDKFEFVIEEASKFAGWFADNPIKGVGAIVLAAVAKDLASAGISAAAEAGVAAIMKRIAAAIGGGGGGGSVLSTPAGKVGTLGKIGAVAGALTAGVAIGEIVAPLLIDPMAERAAQNQRDAVAKGAGASNTASSLYSKIRSGKVTATDIAAAQGELKSASKDVARANYEAKESGGFFSTADGVKNAKAAQKSAEQSFDMLNKAIQAATSALQKMGTTASNTDPRRNLPISQRSAL